MVLAHGAMADLIELEFSGIVTGIEHDGWLCNLAGVDVRPGATVEGM